MNKKSYDKKIIKKIIHESVFDTEYENLEDKLYDVVIKTINAPLMNGFCLKDVAFENIRPEVEFLFSINNNYIKGFIDLIFSHNNKYYIVDWKTNFLDYNHQKMISSKYYHI